jgi:hypothetical protein
VQTGEGQNRGYRFPDYLQGKPAIIAAEVKKGDEVLKPG